MNQIATITDEGSVHFMTYKGSMNDGRFLTFLGQLLRSATKTILLITDRLKAHEDAAVQEWLQAHQDRIPIFYLPKYFPEMNPVEYMHNDMKTTVNAAGLLDSKDILRSRMQRFMRRLAHLPKHVSNYFLHPFVQYVSAT